jgi:hypothetical protein
LERSRKAECAGDLLDFRIFDPLKDTRLFIDCGQVAARKESGVLKSRRVLPGALIACAIAAVMAPSAMAAPAPGYSQYAGCPNLPDIDYCIQSKTRGGHLKIGNTDTPINQTLTLTGGLRQNARVAYNSQGGLTGNPLEVPGGLTGLTGLSEFIVNLITFGANRVYAQAQLVAEPTVDGESLVLPLRVNLLNPFLRSGCGIGSASNPITLNTTIGTTAPPPPAVPITGRANQPTLDLADPNHNTLLIPDDKFVDNAFSAPGASGCDLIGFGLLNGLVNARSGLPSAAGRNEAILDHTDIRLVPRPVVYP